MAKVKNAYIGDEADGRVAAILLNQARDQRAFVLSFIKHCDPLTLAHFVAECDATPSPKPPTRRPAKRRGK
jgi:hypothetical protein